MRHSPHIVAGHALVQAPVQGGDRTDVHLPHHPPPRVNPGPDRQPGPPSGPQPTEGLRVLASVFVTGPSEVPLPLRAEQGLPIVSPSYDGWGMTQRAAGEAH